MAKYAFYIDVNGCSNMSVYNSWVYRRARSGAVGRPAQTMRWNIFWRFILFNFFLKLEPLRNTLLPKISSVLIICLWSCRPLNVLYDSKLIINEFEWSWLWHITNKYSKVVYSYFLDKGTWTELMTVSITKIILTGRISHVSHRVASQSSKLSKNTGFWLT